MDQLTLINLQSTVLRKKCFSHIYNEGFVRHTSHCDSVLQLKADLNLKTGMK